MKYFKYLSSLPFSLSFCLPPLLLPLARVLGTFLDSKHLLSVSKYPSDGSALQHKSWLLEMSMHRPFSVQILSRCPMPGCLSPCPMEKHRSWLFQMDEGQPYYGSLLSFFPITSNQPWAFRIFPVRDASLCVPPPNLEGHFSNFLKNNCVFHSRKS